MNRPSADKPERLLASDATDFERRVLEAAMRQKPSAASSQRMARAIGVTAAAVGTATTATTLAAGATATKAAAAGATAVWPWVTISVVGLVVAGAVVGTRSGREARAPQVSPPAVTAPLPPPASPATEPATPALPEESPARAVAPSQRVRAAATATSELREQVALLDSARQAMSEGASQRALEILRRYLDKYPTGSFRPEATAIRIEALMKVGREAEARALAQRFVAENRGSLLARRVADIAGLADR